MPLERFGFIVKAIAVVLVFQMVWIDLVWAVDVRQMIVDAKKSFETLDQDRKYSNRYSTDQFTDSQSQVESEIEAQEELQNLEGLNFSLTTPNGDIIDYLGNQIHSIRRPDGTLLTNVQLSPNGEISHADLRLVDGSIQIFHEGSVLAYRRPDGTQVFYENGLVQRTESSDGVVTSYSYTKDASGEVIETILDSPGFLAVHDRAGLIRENHSKSDGTRTFFVNGLLTRIEKSDGSLYTFRAEALGDDTLVRLDGSRGSEVRQIQLPDGLLVTDIVWGSDNKIKDGILRTPDGSTYEYLDKSLVQKVDPTGIATDYSYAPGKIYQSSLGTTHEFLSDGTALGSVWPDGTRTSYFTSGTYKGYRQTDVSSLGVLWTYEYTGTGAGLSVKKFESVSTVVNTTTVQGVNFLPRASYPQSKFFWSIPSDVSNPSVTFNAINNTGTRNLALRLLVGTNSTYAFGNTTRSLGVNILKDKSYCTEVRWEQGRIALYVYEASSARPVNPQGVLIEAPWDPKFQITANNAPLTLDASSSGTYVRSVAVSDGQGAFQSGRPTERIDFRFLSNSGINNRVFLSSAQAVSGTIRRTVSFAWQSGFWTTTRSDYNTSTGTTANATVRVAQALVVGQDYIAELRHESNWVGLFVYPKGRSRPAVAIASSATFDVASKLEASVTNASAAGRITRNTTSVTSAQARAPLPEARLDFIRSLAQTKSYGPAQELDFTSILYDASARYKEIAQKDGSRLIFESGFLKEALDAQGRAVRFDFAQSGLGNILSSRITTDDVVSVYDESGRLSSIAYLGLKIHYKESGEGIDYIETENGDEIYEPVFADGNIVDAKIYSANGDLRVYEAGRLVRMARSDRSEYTFLNGLLDTYATPG